MDVDAQAPVMTQDPAPLDMAAIGGELQPAVAPRHDAATQCRPLTSLVESGTQMEGRLYTFGKRDLLLFFRSYEYLVSQETVAVRSHISHRPAFSYVRQALREGRRPGMQLPTERPIDMPDYHRRRGESDWLPKRSSRLAADAPRVGDVMFGSLSVASSPRAPEANILHESGREFAESEVLTYRGVMRRGILLQELSGIREGVDKRGYPVRVIAKDLTPMVLAQWKKSNAQFAPPVVVIDRS
ncbi:hypothetical protein GWK47_004020 [Chionoecetes opilio]|uniref:Uncharacterized protein n=1 Tax=Chionoecetes opilio TaxID=41210 RepID=A0A8J4YHG5_CHIOP|nr:hypothetical protein GWK47_004020 [Chionoecetes opilio]